MPIGLILSFLKGAKANWKPILIGVVCLLFFGSGWYIRGNIEDARRAKELQQNIEQRLEDEKKALEKSEKLEGELAALRKKSRSLNLKLEKEIAKNSAYNSCIVPADGVQLLNEAITSGKAAR